MTDGRLTDSVGAGVTTGGSVFVTSKGWLAVIAEWYWHRATTVCSPFGASSGTAIGTVNVGGWASANGEPSSSQNSCTVSDDPQAKSLPVAVIWEPRCPDGASSVKVGSFGGGTTVNSAVLDTYPHDAVTSYCVAGSSGTV